MSGILGRKIGMSQTFEEEGGLTPVTVIQAGPCRVVDQRTTDRDGYTASILGFEQVEGTKANRAKLGYLKKMKAPVFRILKEFRGLELELGSEMKVEQFAKGDTLVVQGVSKGKGFAGAIKRWNFSRGRETHGGNFNRALGGTGMCEFPGRVYKGRKMAGRMGGDTVTIKSVKVIDVLPEDNLLVVKGPIPGNKNEILVIKKAVA